MSQPITSQFPVHIIGAGPGAPDLITVRGQTLLSAADTVFYTGSLATVRVQDCVMNDNARTAMLLESGALA
ncbi:MAG: SAM-dependent methyltransferase, partial [Cyanobacteria bacterium P01_D01_bin.123]